MFAIVVIALLGTTTVVGTGHAQYFYNNVRFVRGPTYHPSYHRPTANTLGRVCLYRNSWGECMIEQYPTYGSVPYNRYRTSAPTYSRHYLYHERRYSNRDDDDDFYNYEYFDDDFCDDDFYYDDDDDFYYDDDDDVFYVDDDFFDDDD